MIRSGWCLSHNVSVSLCILPCHLFQFLPLYHKVQLFYNLGNLVRGEDVMVWGEGGGGGDCCVLTELSIRWC